jgi:LmbE family N-acetylglucosaminyl deacetylase
VSRAATRVVDRARFALKAAIVARGRDVTATVAVRSSLVVAPHPDDETLGCGATIMRKVAAGTPVRVVIATDGRYSSVSEKVAPEELAAMRRDEALEATRRLGLDPGDVEFLGFQDKQLLFNQDALRDRLAAILDDFRPDEILTSSVLDSHGDHQAGGLAIRALMAAGRVHCPVLEYPMGYWRTFPWQARPRNPVQAGWSFVSGAASALVRLRPDLVSTQGLLERKREVIEAYDSQLRNLTDEASWWTLGEQFLAQFLGPYEVFIPVRR